MYRIGVENIFTKFLWKIIFLQNFIFSMKVALKLS